MKFREVDEGWYENEEGTFALSHPRRGYEKKTGKWEAFRLNKRLPAIDEQYAVYLFSAATKREAIDKIDKGAGRREWDTPERTGGSA
jgi:hypothetical protein